MEKNCFIQSLIGNVSDKKMKGYLQEVDFSNSVAGIGYEVGKYWKDNNENKGPSENTCAIDIITLPYVRNGTIVRSKNPDYLIAKVSAKVGGIYKVQNGSHESLMYQEISGNNIALYITLKRTDSQPITEQLVISDIVEILTQYPTTCPNINNPLIEIKDYQYVETQETVLNAFNKASIGDYLLYNYAHESVPYKLVRKDTKFTYKVVEFSQDKTVKVGDKYYVYNGTMWEELK